jgi:cytochrome oxidase assembly protein ShyY1
VELTSSTPPQADGLTLLPLPELSEGPHLSYVGQWILIGLASIVIWVIVVRREAAHGREQATASAGAAPGPGDR